jgi:hypothetical protein
VVVGAMVEGIIGPYTQYGIVGSETFHVELERTGPQLKDVGFCPGTATVLAVLTGQMKPEGGGGSSRTLVEACAEGVKAPQSLKGHQKGQVFTIRPQEEGQYGAKHASEWFGSAPRGSAYAFVSKRSKALDKMLLNQIECSISGAVVNEPFLFHPAAGGVVSCASLFLSLPCAVNSTMIGDADMSNNGVMNHGTGPRAYAQHLVQHLRHDRIPFSMDGEAWWRQQVDLEQPLLPVVISPHPEWEHNTGGTRGITPQAGLLMTCTGRGRGLHDEYCKAGRSPPHGSSVKGTLRGVESSAMAALLPGLPLIGCFSNGEIGPIRLGQLVDGDPSGPELGSVCEAYHSVVSLMGHTD